VGYWGGTNSARFRLTPDGPEGRGYNISDSGLKSVPFGDYPDADVPKSAD